MQIKKRKKILFIISEIDKSLEFEWMACGLRDDFDLHFVIINRSANVPYMSTYLHDLGIPCYLFTYTSKIDIPKILSNLYKLIRKIEPEIVHTHLLIANLLGLTAARLAGVRRRIYTRHHSSYNHIYHPHGVIYDRYSNYLATDIVATSPVVKRILMEWEKVAEDKIHYIPHGLNFDYFERVSDIEISEVARKYVPPGKWPVIGVISRFTEWKGVQYVIPAFARFLAHYPDAYLILANAVGDYTEHIHKLLLELPEGSFRTIRFEAHTAALYKLFNIFIHVPIDEHSEAFGQVYIEAMAAGVPMVCTISGIAHEIIQHGRNAYVVPYKDSEAILQGMLTLIGNPDMATKIVKQAKEDVKIFSLDRKIKLLQKLYSS